MSKGSNRRPAAVDEAEIEERWARIFARPAPSDPQPAPDPAGQPEETQQ